MNILVQFVIILILFTSLNGGSELPLYNLVQSNLNKYKQSINSVDFAFQNGIIHLDLNGRRTNIKSQLLVGFYSVGVALNRVNVHCIEIEVEIHYEGREGSQVSIRAAAEHVQKLGQGRLSSEQFFTLIGY